MNIHLFHESAVFRFVLIFALAILSNMVFENVLDFFAKEPAVLDFCKEEQVRIIPETEKECITLGGKWVPDLLVQKGLPKPGTLEPPPIEVVREGYCNVESTCLGAYDRARLQTETTRFISFALFGLLLVGGSLALRRKLILSVGLFVGGLLAFTVGAARYWHLMSEWAQMFILVAGLLVSVWIALKHKKSAPTDEIYPRHNDE